MKPADDDPFVLLTTLGDPDTAEVYAALLRSAGIPSRLQSEALGPYRLTVGRMAETRVWVPRPRLEEAQELLATEGWDTLPDEEGLEDRGVPGDGPGR